MRWELERILKDKGVSYSVSTDQSQVDCRFLCSFIFKTYKKLVESCFICDVS